jgi:hypothetical protein
MELPEVILQRLEETVLVKREQAFQHCFIATYELGPEAIERCLRGYAEGLRIMEGCFARYVRNRRKSL